MTTPVMTQTTSSAPADNGMNGGLPTGANHILHARVLGRAITSLESTYAALEPGTVRATVHAAYRELDRTARLKTHLPALALRRAEDHLRQLAARPTEHGGTMTAVPAAA